VLRGSNSRPTPC